MPALSAPVILQPLQSPEVILPRRRKARPKHPPNTQLSAKEQSFVNSLLEGIDKKTAYLSAGYTPNFADIQLARILRRPKIRAALSLARDEAANKLGVNADYVVETIKQEIEYLRSNKERAAAASQAILRASELLGKHVGMFAERIEEDRRITVTIERIG